MTTNPIPEPSDELVLQVATFLERCCEQTYSRSAAVVIPAGHVTNAAAKLRAAIAAMPELSALQEKVRRLEHLLDCARDEYESTYGRIKSDDEPHWSVQARTALTDTVGGV